MEPVKIGVLGLGTVGEATVNVLCRNADDIMRRAGRRIAITHAAVRDIERKRYCNTDEIVLTTDPFAVVNDPEIDVVVELIGGTGIAKEVALAAIANGKHVVTANKALIALHGNEIFAAAQAQDVMVAFEAAVAGGIPIIKVFRESLAGNSIKSIAGIINGTSNYILTEMWDEGREFADVLAEAQLKGYAEADPTMDVEGIDVGHKLTILASIALGIPLQFDKAYIEGISQITPCDVVYAAQLGYRIKHLGIVQCREDGIELRAHPALIPERSILANVNGVMNAVMIDADAVGTTLHYGAGAGGEPTASAVVADVVDVVRTLTADPENRVPHLAFQSNALSDKPILSITEVKTAYYLRLHALDRAGVLADVTKILGRLEISIEALLQKERADDHAHVPVVILTHSVQESKIDQALIEIEALEGIAGPVARLRVADYS